MNEKYENMNKVVNKWKGFPKNKCNTYNVKKLSDMYVIRMKTIVP